MANHPNMFELHGGGIHVSYSTTSIGGQPLFTYHDALQLKNFSGDQIKSVQTEIGTLVTVVIHLTIDQGSTTFSLLVPNVILPASNVANIAAEGITTLHKFSIPPPVGQTEFYAARSMHGIARFVIP